MDHDFSQAPRAASQTTPRSLEQRVAESSLLRGSGESVIELLRNFRLCSRSLAAGEHVFQIGDPADALYLLFGVKAGRDGLAIDPLVQLELKPLSGKRPLRLERIVDGEVFGEIEFLNQGLNGKPTKRTTAAFALTPAMIVALPVTHFSGLFERSPFIRERLIRIGSQRLLTALQQQHEQLRIHPDLLLANWLVEMTVDVGIVEGNRVRFPRRIPQSDIAADLGVSRETISRRLNEWERSGLLRTGARSQHIEILDYQRVSRLASLHSSRSRAALQRTVADIDAAIASGDLVRARNIGLDIVRFYPSSPELHHRIALAAARSGDIRGSLDQLLRSGLPFGGSISVLEAIVRKARSNPFLPIDRLIKEDWIEEGYAQEEVGGAEAAQVEHDTGRERQLVEDLAALHARLLKEQAFAATKATDRQEKALSSFSSYHALYQHRRGYYPGINAATMALIAGDRARAKEIANGVLASLAPDAEDYWPLATRAEALLISGRQAEAAAVLAHASFAGSEDDGAKASTILQLRRLLTVLDGDLDALVDALKPHNVAVISGHMFRGGELSEAEQSEAEAAIREQAAELFTLHNVGFVYGALACGSDIILAETALELGAEFDAVLPFNTEDFIATSVTLGDPASAPGKWEKRVRALLETGGASSLTIMDPADPIDRDLDGYFFYGFRYAAGSALQRATVLETGCRLMVVADQVAPDNIAGASRVLQDWREHGRPLDLIPFPYQRPRRPGRARAATAFRPVVFVWDARGADASPKSLERLRKTVAPGLPFVNRTHRDGREGFCLITEDTEGAIAIGLAAVKAVRRAKLELRVICDFGIVLGSNLKPDKKLIARLQAADDFPGLPTDCLLATELFAAQAKFDLDDSVLLTPVARAEPYAAANGEGQGLRSRPTLPIFSVRRSRKKA